MKKPVVADPVSSILILVLAVLASTVLFSPFVFFWKLLIFSFAMAILTLSFLAVILVYRIEQP